MIREVSVAPALEPEASGFAQDAGLVPSSGCRHYYVAPSQVRMARSLEALSRYAGAER